MDYKTTFFPGSISPFDPGVSLKAQHYQHILQTKPNITWFELHPENLTSGTTLAYVEKIRKDYLLSFHSVGLSLGSEFYDEDHLKTLSTFVRRLSPSLISTHVSWNYHDGTYFDCLLPLPYTEESFHVVANNIDKVQNAFGCTILVENIGSYFQAPGSSMDEASFIISLAKKTGCQILLDINNAYINARNHSFDVQQHLKSMAQSGFVGEIHLGGHEEKSLPHGREVLIDSHNCVVSDPVWALYQDVLKYIKKPVPTLIEWDASLPAFGDLLKERAQAQHIIQAAYEPHQISEYI